VLLHNPIYKHAVVITPVVLSGAFVVHLAQQRRPSPKFRRVGFHITLFEACSTFTRVTACLFAKSPYVILSTGGFDDFITSTIAPIATGWNDQLPGGILTH